MKTPIVLKWVHNHKYTIWQNKFLEIYSPNMPQHANNVLWKSKGVEQGALVDLAKNGTLDIHHEITNMVKTSVQQKNIIQTWSNHRTTVTPHYIM